MAANTADAITVTMARPPVRCRTSTPAAWTRRLDSPPAVISSPASMNSGIASRLKDCEPATICCAKKAGSMSATTHHGHGREADGDGEGHADRGQPDEGGHQHDRGDAHGGGGAPACCLAPAAGAAAGSAGHHALDGEQADQRAGERGHAVQDLDGIGDRRRHRPARELDEAKPRPAGDRRRTPKRSGRCRAPPRCARRGAARPAPASAGHGSLRGSRAPGRPRWSRRTSGSPPPRTTRASARTRSA